MGTFDPIRFFQSVESVALHVPADELFGLLKRSLDLPSSWTALVQRNTGDHVVVEAGGQVLCDDVEDVLFARVTPLDLTIENEEIVTRDSFRCSASVRLRVCLGAQRSDLTSFKHQVLGSHRAVTISRLADYFRPAVRQSLSESVAKRNADELLGGRGSASLSEALSGAVEAACFSAGLVMDRAAEVTLASTTFAQVRQAQEDASRRQQAHQATDQVREALRQAQERHLDHLSSLLTRLDGLAEQSPNVNLTDLMRTFSQQQRGELYGALFAAKTVGAKTRWIVVASGMDLLFFDPQDLANPARRFPVTGAAGQVRSLETSCTPDGQLVLLMGAATGVYRMSVDRNEPDLTLTVPDASDTRGGFNAVAAAGSSIFASHSELGLYQWNVEEPASGRALFPSMTGKAKAVRQVQFFDGDIYCSVDDRIIRWPADTSPEQPSEVYTGSMSTITALAVGANGLHAGNCDGDVLHWPPDHPSSPERVHTGGGRSVESVWALQTSGVPRLIYSDTSLHVYDKVVGDSFCCRYAAGGQTLRRVEIAPDLVVATNDLRDRLILWAPGQPEKPTGTIIVSALSGHSIQDSALVLKL